MVNGSIPVGHETMSDPDESSLNEGESEEEISDDIKD